MKTVKIITRYILIQNIVADIGAILASLVTLMWKNYKEKVAFICKKKQGEGGFYLHHLT